MYFRLNVVFSNDFISFIQKYRYDCFRSHEWFSFDGDDQNSLVFATLSFRKNHNLPNQYLILEWEDTCAILLKTQDSRDQVSPVIWCDHEDLDNLCQGKPFEYNPTIFPTFTDFFQHLVNI